MSENSILDALVYDQSSGSLLYRGVRYMLIRPETIAGFQKALVESCGRQAEDGLFAGGYSGGSLSAQKYKELHNFSDQEVIEFMMNMGNQIGWGISALTFMIRRRSVSAFPLRIHLLPRLTASLQMGYAISSEVSSQGWPASCLQGTARQMK